jgi:hypothetical protein
MGIDVFRHVGCPEAKLIEKFGWTIIPETTSIYLISVIYERISTGFDVP